MIRKPLAEERPFARNNSEHVLTFYPGTLKIARGCGVWIDEHWVSFDDFRFNKSVMDHHRLSRLVVEYILPGEPAQKGSAC